MTRRILCVGWLLVVGVFVGCQAPAPSIPTSRGNESEQSSVLSDRLDAPPGLAVLARPAPRAHLQEVGHSAYDLGYHESHEQAAWVAYVLEAEELVARAKRRDNFRSDPAVRTGSAELSDYRRSGFDRGHLAPARDMAFSARTMSESFFLSNMSPQVPAFNRGIWSRLERQVRQWAKDEGSLVVVTGPIFNGRERKIGPNGVSVPHRFYKVILDYEPPEVKAIGFILLNEGSSRPLSSFAVPVDEVERLTGLDFFAALPDYQEEQLESQDWSESFGR
ncbi:MAG: DNA/RNA non-specific endonuclease [Planctomycetota bacterium]